MWVIKRPSFRFLFIIRRLCLCYAICETLCYSQETGPIRSTTSLILISCLCLSCTTYRAGWSLWTRCYKTSLNKGGSKETSV